LRKTIKNIPLSKVMIETDCPYLIPKDLLNKPKNNRNEPYHLNHIATAVANLMKVDEEKLREQTYKNSLGFFEA
jgi:TatD DNase family protein